jgi:hypothetical protein
VAVFVDAGTTQKVVANGIEVEPDAEPAYLLPGQVVTIGDKTLVLTQTPAGYFLNDVTGQEVGGGGGATVQPILGRNITRSEAQRALAAYAKVYNEFAERTPMATSRLAITENDESQLLRNKEFGIRLGAPIFVKRFEIGHEARLRFDEFDGVFYFDDNNVVMDKNNDPQPFLDFEARLQKAFEEAGLPFELRIGGGIGGGGIRPEVAAFQEEVNNVAAKNPATLTEAESVLWTAILTANGQTAFGDIPAYKIFADQIEALSQTVDPDSLSAEVYRNVLAYKNGFTVAIDGVTYRVLVDNPYHHSLPTLPLL